jgi:DNA/RNA-binding protein KIN17
MRIFAENPNSILDSFSREFEKGFLQCLSHGHGSKRVLANRVYQEYIADKHHVHMNGTTWTTLSGFCKYLGKEGKAIVEETEKGWYIQYIDRDPKAIAKQLQNEARKQHELNEEEQHKLFIEQQIKIAFERKGQQQSEEFEDELEDSEAPKENSIATKPLQINQLNNKKRKLGCSAFAAESDEENENAEEVDAHAGVNNVLKKMIVEDQIRQGKFAKGSQPPSATVPQAPITVDYGKNWVLPQIMVKIVSQQSSHREYYKRKGVVVEALDKEYSMVEIDSKTVRFRYDELQTVVGKVSGGIYSECVVTIYSLDIMLG